MCRLEVLLVDGYLVNIGSIQADRYLVICEDIMSCQVNPKDLDKESFWVKVHEDSLASEDLFAELKQNFASKTVCEYTFATAVLHHYD